MLDELFNRSTYDTSVISHFALYDSLRKILIPDVDTLFKFRHLYPKNGESVPLRFDCNRAARDGPGPFEIGPKTMPAFMYPAVQHVCAALGKDKIDFFMIWPDSTIELFVRDCQTDKATKAYVCYILYYYSGANFRPVQDPFTFIKDTVVAPGWYYTIQMTEYFEK